jgi:hypothetical protein
MHIQIGDHYESMQIHATGVIENRTNFTYAKTTNVCMSMGMWLSGRAFALHVKGPGFDPRHLQNTFFVIIVYQNALGTGPQLQPISMRLHAEIVR